MIVLGMNETQTPGMLSLPVGKVERTAGPDHVLEQALRREIAEEVGISVDQAMLYLQSAAFTMDTTDPVSESAEVDSAAWRTIPEIVAHPRAPEWMATTIARAERLRSRVGW
jgi:NADH pyrophosphatase NudC (nudix superfamily)